MDSWRPTHRYAVLYTALVSVHFALPAAAAESGETEGVPLWLQLLFAFFLVALSALFAGLTIGIMGLDTLTLEIIATSGSEPDRTYAKVLLPVRKLGHQALCTLVLGNMWANVMIAQFCADILPDSGGASGVLGFLLSTLVILVFAEILPMTICKSSNALKVAAGGVPILKVFIVLLWPLAKPLGMLLDKLIHHDVGQVYDREELKRLMVLHYETHGDRSGLQQSELSMMLGAMAFHEGVVGDVMTPIEKVFMLSEQDLLSEELLAKIWQKGFSRIPVSQAGSPGHIVGVLYAKDLVLLSSEKPSAGLTTVGAFLRKTLRRSVCSVGVKMKLPAMIKHLQTGRAHLYLVREAPEDEPKLNTSVVLTRTVTDPNNSQQLSTSTGKVVGIITMEDIVEKLIGGEIYDEDDKNARLPRVSMNSFTIDSELRKEQFWAIARFLRESVESFAHFQIEILCTLLQQSAAISTICPPGSLRLGADEYGSPNAPGGKSLKSSIDAPSQNGSPTTVLPSLSTMEPHLVLYRANQPTDLFTLILCGNVDVIAGGAEIFRSQFRRFMWLGERALRSPAYTPSFTAVVRSPTRILQLRKETYDLATALSEARASPKSILTTPHPAEFPHSRSR